MRNAFSLYLMHAIVLVLVAALPLGAADLAPPIDRHQALALEAGYILPPFAFEDAYRGALGAGLLYEIRGLFPRFPISLGAILAYHAFLSPDDSFGPSSMLQVGAFTGYPFSFGLPGNLSLSASPYLGYTHYFRQHSFHDEITRTNRPVSVLGLDTRLRHKMLLGGIRVEYNLLWENSLLHTMAVYCYAGISR